MDCSINGILPESPNGITAPSTIHASSVRLGAKPEQFEPAASYCQAVPFGWIGRALPPPPKTPQAHCAFSPDPAIKWRGISPPVSTTGYTKQIVLIMRLLKPA